MKRLGYYSYPTHHTVSFSLIAQSHIRHLRLLGAEIYEVPEIALPFFRPVRRSPLVIHPLLYIGFSVLNVRLNLCKAAYWQEAETKLADDLDSWLSSFSKVVGVDVADSDRISELAVRLTEMCDAVVVPSTSSREAYVSSGVRVPVHVVPHGVEDSWIDAPNYWQTAPVERVPSQLLSLYTLKRSLGLKLITFFLWHSEERKGWPEVAAAYTSLANTRKDVALVIVTMTPAPHLFRQLGGKLAVNLHGFFDEEAKRAIYDLSDVVLVLSRGGGFELCALEALARGVPVVTGDWGPFTDYVPREMRVPARARVPVFKGNLFHTGLGSVADVAAVVEKVIDVLDNRGWYVELAHSWVENVVRPKFTWRAVTRRLADLLFG